MDDEPAVGPDPDRPLPPQTWRDVLDRVVPPARAVRVRALLAAAALAVAGGVAYWALRPPPVPAAELTLPLASPAAPGAEGGSSTSSPLAAVELVVHAAGAVVAPGLYRVPAGSRVADLLAVAGGPAPDADLDRINLAAALADGERVWFARVGEDPPLPVPGASGDRAGPTGPMDLNSATVAQLEELPGIGPSIAAAIVEHRERNGAFGSVDELLEVPGIGPARLEELRPLVTV